jgi:hypothetical protein
MDKRGTGYPYLLHPAPSACSSRSTFGNRGAGFAGTVTS